jgi:hypothetical protein
MRVADLAAMLAGLPQDLEIWIDDNEYGPFQPGKIVVKTINIRNKFVNGKWEREDREVALMD